MSCQPKRPIQPLNQTLLSGQTLSRTVAHERQTRQVELPRVAEQLVDRPRPRGRSAPGRVRRLGRRGSGALPPPLPLEPEPIAPAPTTMAPRSQTLRIDGRVASTRRRRDDHERREWRATACPAACDAAARPRDRAQRRRAAAAPPSSAWSARRSRSPRRPARPAGTLRPRSQGARDGVKQHGGGGEQQAVVVDAAAHEPEHRLERGDHPAGRPRPRRRRHQLAHEQRREEARRRPRTAPTRGASASSGRARCRRRRPWRPRRLPRSRAADSWWRPLRRRAGSPARRASAPLPRRRPAVQGGRIRLSKTIDRNHVASRPAITSAGSPLATSARRRRPPGFAEVDRVGDVLVLVRGLEGRREDGPRDRVDERDQRARPIATRIGSAARSGDGGDGENRHRQHRRERGPHRPRADPPGFRPPAALGHGGRRRPPRLAARPVPADSDAALHVGRIADDLRRIARSRRGQRGCRPRCARRAARRRSPVAVQTAARSHARRPHTGARAGRGARRRRPTA